MNIAEIPDSEWEAMAAMVSGHSVTAPLPAPTTAAPPIAVAPASVPTPEEDNEPVKIRSADEFLAALAKTGTGLPSDAQAVSELLQPLPLPIRQNVIVNPPALGRHQPTVRTEVIELRREIVELARILGELTRIVGEIHALVLAGGR